MEKGRDAIYDNDRSVWFERELADLDLDGFMPGASRFLVVQSNTGIPPDDVWETVRAILE